MAASFFDSGCVPVGKRAVKCYTLYDGMESFLSLF